MAPSRMPNAKPAPRDALQTYKHAEILQAWKDAYDSKEYAKSIQIVESAIRSCEMDLEPNQKIALLDSKCSSYVKLDDLDTALEIAKAMIRVDKTVGVGYCRIASIEKARLNYAMAVKFLDHGYIRVSKSDKYFQHLVKQRTNVKELATEAVVMAKATDPMTVLPLELLQFVLAYLDYKQIVAMLRVSKSWKRVLCRLEPVYDTIDFRKSFKQISYPGLRAALNRAGRLKVLAIDKLSSSAGEVLSKKFLQAPIWISLAHLILNDKKVPVQNIPFGKMKLEKIHFGLDTKISMDGVFKILSQCQTLKEAVFRRVGGGSNDLTTPHTNLEVLELGNAFDFAAFSILPEHFTHYPNLRSLTVNGAACSLRSSWDLRQNSHLVKLDTYACIIRSIHLPGSLEEWLWDGTEVQSLNMSSILGSSPTPLPHLHTICFSGDNAPAALSFLQASKVSFGQLRRVGLHNRQNGDVMTATSNVLDMLNSVEDFSFESESLLDQHASQFAARYPDVISLQLAAPRITGVFIADLLRRPNNRIQRLVLRDCAKVPRDAIDWARAQGVKVEVHIAKIEVRGGRRLREGWF